MNPASPPIYYAGNARSLRCTGVSDHNPCSHWQAHTVVAALRPTELTATAVFDGLVESGVIKPVVDKAFPLEHVRDALACSESGRATGKVVI